MSAADTTPPDPAPGSGPGAPARRRYRGPSSQGQAPRRVDRNHTRVVRVLRTLLPLIALALVAALLILPGLNEDAPPPEAPASDPTQPTGEARVLNPRYFATDAQDRPYSVTADSARGLAEADETLELDRPVAELILETGETLSLTAFHGRYERTADRLELSGGVTLRRDDGYVITTESVEVDLLGQRAWSLVPVQMIGPQVEMSASGFEIEEGGDIVRLIGPATLILRPAAPEIPAP